MRPTSIQCRRIYDPPRRDDGVRVLVDRLWPRGMRKEDAKLEQWAKHLAPSNELRKAFHDNTIDFDAFARRYRRELAEHGDEVEALLNHADGRVLTLLYGSTNREQNHAMVLQIVLSGR